MICIFANLTTSAATNSCLLLSECRPWGYLIRPVATEEEEIERRKRRRWRDSRVCFISLTGRVTRKSLVRHLSRQAFSSKGRWSSRCILICTLTDSFPILIYKQITPLFKFLPGNSPGRAPPEFPQISRPISHPAYLPVKFFVTSRTVPLSALQNLLL